MGIGDLFKRRRERESALPPETLAELGGGEPTDSLAPDESAALRAGGEERAAGEASAGVPGPEASAREPGPEAGAGEPSSEGVELPGADAGELGSMLRRAAASGLPQVSTESHRVDAAGGGLGKEILGILGGGGLAGTGMREVDPDELRELHDSVREALDDQPGPDAHQPGPDAHQPGPDAHQPGPDAP